MSERVELVRRLYDAVKRRDAETVLSLYDPEVEWDFSGSWLRGTLEQDVYRGHEGLRQWWREWSEAWEEYEDEYAELIDTGSHVISPVTSRGVGRSSGVAVEWSQWGVWTIRAGRVIRVAWLSERDEALEAAGLPPGGSPGAVAMQRMIAAFGSGEPDAVAAAVEPDVVWRHNIGHGSPMEGVYEGRDAVRALWGELFEIWDVRGLDGELVEESDERVRLAGTATNWGRATGVELSFPASVALTHHEGRVVEVDFHASIGSY